MKTVEFDIIFLSYDEPNADLHYADLCNKAPWAKRVHGVKGSDHAHKAAAELSETDWFITVDADNIVHPSFFDLDIDTTDPKIQVYGWCGRNSINGLRYGNGGLKIWKKEFVLNMQTHENSTSERGQVDFCWEDGYKNFPKVYSDSIITGSPFQAWRAGFREGVKMTLVDGVKIPSQEIKERVWWHNIHRLRMWSTVGAHKDNGLFAVLGARQGTFMSNCTDWDYVQVRDFEELRRIYNETIIEIEADTFKINQMIQDLGYLLNTQLGFDWPNFNAQQSKYIVDLYDETINLNNTYYQQCTT
jgi:hypothetical protein